MSASEKSYHPTEEKLHSLSHAFAAVLSLIGCGFLVAKSWSLGGQAVFASLAFGLSLFLLYLSSSCYHGTETPARKALWRKLDHAAIYLLIAGSYTPFTLISLRDSWGFWLVAVVWGVAAVGILLEFVAHLKFKKLSLVLYLVMGWLALVAANPLMQNVPTEGLWWLLAGGLCYSFGVIFYLWHSLFLHHVIWHLWVVAGSVCHFISVYFYVL
ncbi:MAG: hemolysin III family protein [Gammaproteobacteria bacterium]|jgi:hemolysin III|nr:hemolysin III family protein [Gammaproteobacteria bacterium]MBU2222818.1 hemolysin III family protein [Gammaproteobacteria bacterium]